MSAGNEIFGRLASGEAVERITIAGGGLTAHVLTWGAVIQDLRLEGHDAPLVLGFEDLASYLEHSPYFGATPGRCANRIAGGRFSIEGTAYQLECNERGVTHLHGGSDGTGRRNWRIAAQGADFVTLTITDPAGRAGYPGNCAIACTYRLSGGGTLSVAYEATTDAPTPANLCQHSYFILDGGADAFGHEISLTAEHYLPVDENLIPTGEVRPVAGTPFATGRRSAARGKRAASPSTTISAFPPRGRKSAPSPRCAARFPACRCRSRPPSPACSSIPAPMWTLPFPVSAAGTTGLSPASALKRRSGRMPSTTAISPMRCCAPARRCGRKRTTCSARPEPSGTGLLQGNKIETFLTENPRQGPGMMPGCAGLNAPGQRRSP